MRINIIDGALAAWGIVVIVGILIYIFTGVNIYTVFGGEYDSPSIRPFLVVIFNFGGLGLGIPKLVDILRT